MYLIFIFFKIFDAFYCDVLHKCDSKLNSACSIGKFVHIRSNWCKIQKTLRQAADQTKNERILSTEKTRKNSLI